MSSYNEFSGFDEHFALDFNTWRLRVDDNDVTLYLQQESMSKIKEWNLSINLDVIEKKMKEAEDALELLRKSKEELTNFIKEGN